MTTEVKVKLFNNIKNCFETHTVKQVETGTLPYKLAFDKFLLKNGFTYGSQSFFNIDVLREAFNEIRQFKNKKL